MLLLYVILYWTCERAARVCSRSDRPAASGGVTGQRTGDHWWWWWALPPELRVLRAPSAAAAALHTSPTPGRRGSSAHAPPSSQVPARVGETSSWSRAGRRRHFPPPPPPVFPVKFKIGGGRRPRAVAAAGESGVRVDAAAAAASSSSGWTGLARCDAGRFFSLPAPARPSAAAGGHAASTIYLLPYCCTRDVKIARVCDSATRVCTPPLPPCRRRCRQSLAASRGRVLIPCARGAFPPRVCTRVI